MYPDDGRPHVLIEGGVQHPFTTSSWFSRRVPRRTTSTISRRFTPVI